MEDVTPWDDDEYAEEQNTTGQRLGPRKRRSPISSKGRSGERSGMAGVHMSASISTTLWPPEDHTAEAEGTGTDRHKVKAPRKSGSAVDDTAAGRVATRKATTAARNRKRNKKMVMEEANAEIVGQY